MRLPHCKMWHAMRLPGKDGRQVSDHPLGAVPSQDGHGVVALEAGLNEGSGNDLHLLEKTLVAPFLPLAILIRSSQGDHITVETSCLLQKAWDRHRLLCS